MSSDDMEMAVHAGDVAHELDEFAECWGDQTPVDVTRAWQTVRAYLGTLGAKASAEWERRVLEAFRG